MSDRIEQLRKKALDAAAKYKRPPPRETIVMGTEEEQCGCDEAERASCAKCGGSGVVHTEITAEVVPPNAEQASRLKEVLGLKVAGGGDNPVESVRGALLTATVVNGAVFNAHATVECLVVTGTDKRIYGPQHLPALLAEPSGAHPQASVGPIVLRMIFEDAVQRGKA